MELDWVATDSPNSQMRYDSRKTWCRDSNDHRESDDP